MEVGRRILLETYMDVVTVHVNKSHISRVSLLIHTIPNHEPIVRRERVRAAGTKYQSIRVSCI